MQTKDHLALGFFLLNRANDPALYTHANAFLLGCVEADYNYVSYLRGFLRHKKFYGHNAENSRTYIENRIWHIQSNGLHSAWSYFTLGVMIHYLADSFTAPHNQFWSENLTAHLEYEKKLHDVFANKLNEKKAKPSMDAPASLLQCFHDASKKYAAASRSMETDCVFIIQTCEQVLCGCLRYTRQQNMGKKGIIYENTYHHRLVSTSH